MRIDGPSASRGANLSVEKRFSADFGRALATILGRLATGRAFLQGNRRQGKRENRRFSTFDIHAALDGLILCRALNHLQACRKRVDPNFRKWIFENGCDLCKMFRITQIADTAKTDGMAKSNESFSFRHFSE